MSSLPSEKAGVGVDDGLTSSTLAAAPQIPIPVTRDDYEYLDQIGQGGYYITFKARVKDEAKQEHHLGEFVTIKEIKPSKTDIKSQRAFLKEANHLYNLQDVTGVVKVVNYFVDSKNANKFCLVFEYLGHDHDIKSLRQVADEASMTRSDELAVLSSEQVSFFAVEMIDVLTALHAVIIRHGDIKPENIMLIPSYPLASSVQYKLSEFGSSVCGQDMTLTIVSASPASVSPELLLLASGLSYEPMTIASDLWTFGATLVNLALGFDLRGLDSDRQETKRRIMDLGRGCPVSIE